MQTSIRVAEGSTYAHTCIEVRSLDCGSQGRQPMYRARAAGRSICRMLQCNKVHSQKVVHAGGSGLSPVSRANTLPPRGWFGYAATYVGMRMQEWGVSAYVSVYVSACTCCSGGGARACGCITQRRLLRI